MRGEWKGVKEGRRVRGEGKGRGKGGGRTAAQRPHEPDNKKRYWAHRRRSPSAQLPPTHSPHTAAHKPTVQGICGSSNSGTPSPLP